MKKIVLGAVIAFAFATPSLAQSYSAGYGTGNLIDAPLQKTNGAWDTSGQSSRPRPELLRPLARQAALPLTLIPRRLPAVTRLTTNDDVCVAD
jgi:hypothetical protein